jgi:hypothetical protein
MPSLIQKLLLFGMILLPSLSPGADFTLSGYIDAGERTEGDDYTEEDDDREYRFLRYHLGFEHRMSGRARYRIGSYLNDKDYTTKDSLDNTSRIISAMGSYALRGGEGGNLKVDISLRYREKRYRDSPSDEYDQLIFSPKITHTRKEVYDIYLSSGINNYEYIKSGAKNQNNIFVKVGSRRYIHSKKLVLYSSYRFESATLKKEARKKNKHDLMFGGYYIPDLPQVKKVTFSAKVGQGDTKDIEERDDDLDYRFQRFLIRSEHRMHPRLKANFVYEYFGKDYFESDLDHSGFRIATAWKQGLAADGVREIYLLLSANHKEVNYPMKKERDYRKEGLEIRGVLTRKRNWKTSLSIRGDFYDYWDRTRDRNRYYALITLQKYFFGRSLRLSLDLKYKYTDNRHANNTEEESGRLAFRYTF